MSGGRTAMTQSYSLHGGALSFMSCTSGRESSPLDENDSHQNGEFKTETKKKRFHPLRNLRRMFRRKTRHSSVSNNSYNLGSPESTEINTTPLEQRSCSTSKLAEENGIQNLIKSSRLAPGLSLSHDSVFTPDRADSGLSSSDLENSSLSISNFVPPPVEYPLKSHSSCSESSLLSMDSSEVELSPTIVKSDLDLGITSYKLSHSAAKHKMAVKPKRNHGAPRTKRRTVNSKSPLPSTPEVNEEAMGVKGFASSTTDFHAEVFNNSLSSKPSSPIAEVTVNESKLLSKSFESDFVVTSKIVRSKLSAERLDESGTGEKDETAKFKSGEEFDVSEDDWGEKDGENGSKKEESFFGRLLSRRSEKKKKHNPEKNNEELCAEESMKSSSPNKESLKSSASSRSIHRRQRVEPIEIPSSPSLLKKNEGNARESCNRMKISYSMSPPKTLLTNTIVSRSSSPPKVVWPEHCTYYKNGSQKERNLELGDIISKGEGGNSVNEDSLNKMRRDLSPTMSKTKETQKIIADEVESKFKLLYGMGEERLFKNFETSKDDSSKIMSYEKDEADKYKIKRNQSREEDFNRVHAVKLAAEVEKSLFKSEKFKAVKANVKTSPLDSADKLDTSVSDDTDSLKPASDTFSPTDVLITHEEPHYVNLKNILPVLNSYEKVHHGYENVQVIELVKKEKDCKIQFEDKLKEKAPETKYGDDSETPVEKKVPKFDRPKSMRRDSVDVTPEFMKVQLHRVEPRTEVKMDDKTDVGKVGSPTAAPRTKSTLIERRKSELMLSNEAEEKDWKSKVKVLKKQTSFSESASPKRLTTEGSKEKNEVSASNEKTDPQEEATEVVMRKKTTSAGKGSDDQPELMKVFARRSLKVRESEEIVEEMRRSRDSDKENENSESPKEERKKIIKSEPDDKKQADKTAEYETAKKPDEVIIQVTSLKPEIGIRKCVFQKYGKNTDNAAGIKTIQQENGISSAENKGKTRKEQFILEENKSNKMKEVKTGNDIVTVSCIKEANAVNEEESEETGFKRIQQRKAEWERRVQQAAK